MIDIKKEVGHDKLLNITFGEYYGLDDESKAEYNVWSRLAEPKDCFNIGKLEDNYFGPVKDCQEVYNLDALNWAESWELIGLLLGIENDPKDDKMIAKYKKWMKSMGANKFFDVARTIRWLMHEIDEINRKEGMMLGGVLDADQIDAGVDRLAKYSARIQIDSLCQRYGCTPSVIRREKYGNMLAMMCTIKELDEYKYKLQSIIMEKNSNKNNRRNG